MTRIAPYALPLVEVLRQSGPAADGDALIFHTVRGNLAARYHPVAGGLAEAAVVWLGDSSAGLAGPGDGLYSDVAATLQQSAIESLRLDYRQPNRLSECVSEVLVGVHWLASERGIDRLALVGHGFGGVVAITAAVAADAVRCVAALATPDTDCDALAWLGKPLFLAHGDADTVVPVTSARRLEERARGEVTCRIYPGAGHGFERCRDALADDLRGWLDEQLSP